MFKTATIFFLASSITVIAQSTITHIDENAILSVNESALYYNPGSLQTKGSGKVEINGNIMLVSKSVNDTFKTIDGTNDNFYLRINDKENWKNSTYGQLFIQGFLQENITANINKEFASNKHGDYQQIGLPFFDKQFSSLADEFNATFKNQRWTKQEILKWNNDFVRFDGSIIPTSQISSNSTPGISINLSDKTKLSDRTGYYTIGTLGGFEPENISIVKGIPYSDNLKIALNPQIIDFGTSGNSINIYREKYNTYLNDIFEVNNAWQQTYGKYIYQFSNPFFTNLDLSLVGIDETLFGAEIGDNNNISNIWGISVNPNNVKFSTTTGTTSAYSSNQIVTFDSNNRPVGNIDALIIKPLGTFKIKLRDSNPAEIDFDNLRRFSNIPRSESTSYNVFSKGNNANSLKQVDILLLNENKDEIGETYFALSNDFETGNIQTPNNKSVQAVATPDNLISTYEENISGGIDLNFSTKYRLYINEANENNFEGKELHLSVFDGHYLKFQIRENSKLLGNEDSLSSGKKFYYKKPNGELTEINPNDTITIDSQNYGLYYGKPNTYLDTAMAKPNRTVVTYDRNINKNIVLFDPNWLKADIKIFDYTGKILVDKKAVNTKNIFVIDIEKNIQSTYLINIVSDQGDIVNSKFINR